MDSGLAVILGAVIALVSSAVIPWIRDALTEKRAERARRNRAIDKSIRDLTHALVARSYARPLTRMDQAALDIDARDLLTRFDLLLDGRHEPLSVAIDQAFQDAASDDTELRILARAITPLRLTGWRSGIYTSPDVYKRYMDQRADAEVRAASEA
ncbi:hypothetical protein [Microbacterium sp. NPDC056052]|uniref:hypothetical protein n=1 Tax=Microbacterium sp. NPDC056052 TaxID=3345695 RepID=UPI0035D917D5